MTITYSKTLITDEATDTDSPGTETLFQDKGQSINYVIDVITNAGANSEALNADLSASDIRTLPYYESVWTSIGQGATNDFAHGLGYTPTVVLVWHSASGNYSASNLLGNAIDDATGSNSHHINSVDGTNIQIHNNSVANPQFFLVVAW